MRALWTQIETTERDCGNGSNGQPSGAVRRALCRARSWQTPPNWSSRDWLNEVRAITVAAGSLAELEYEPARGVPLEAFVYCRALASAWTRYRQEWAYYVRFAATPDNGWTEYATVLGAESGPEAIEPLVARALMQLSHTDRCLIQQLFWKRLTESRIAAALGTTQQAVSKRKLRILKQLRMLLATSASLLLQLLAVPACALDGGHLAIIAGCI